jgi:TolA-binding protein
MAQQALAWAEAHPDDPRIPESLRLAVRAARFACGGDPQTDRWAKRAFRLLHGRYPQTDAARRTPYWYGTGRPL